MKKKRIFVIGYQDAALKNIYEWIKLKSRNNIKVTHISKKYFKKKNIESLSKINNKKIIRLKNFKNSKIILGTSEKYLEANIANYFDENKILFYSYLDNLTNLQKRYRLYKNIPKNILVINSITKHEFKKNIKNTKNTKIKNLNMPYQRLLKKKFFNNNRKNTKILYVSSNLKTKIEIKGLRKIFDINFFKKKKIIFLLHPREKISKWKNLLGKYKFLNLKKGVNFYSKNNIKYVFGISSMNLINYSFVGCNSYYLNILKKDKIYKVFKKYNVKLFKKFNKIDFD